ncbi:citrate/2-methylcitrate synthase [Pseudomonas aeruginosa]
MRLEEIARRSYFVKRASSPRTSTSTRGSSSKAIGIPTSMFTVIFALARTVGWICTGRKCSPAHKIGRPRQLYTGPAFDFTALQGSAAETKSRPARKAASAGLFCARPFPPDTKKPAPEAVFCKEGALIASRRRYAGP